MGSKKFKYKTITIQTGSRYEVYQDQDISIHNQLPVGTYIVKFDKIKQMFYLEQADDFVLPAKIYGDDNNKHAERVLDTFEKRLLSTGVLLSGVKGAGKTLLAKKISVLGQERGYPTIVINDKWHGDEFNSFIQRINNRAIILFDEFEKVYEWHEQKKLLTLLDGVFPTKKLFLLTSNSGRDITSFLKNRPGRVYYNFQFGVLEPEFVREYCEDVLKNKDNIEDVVNYVKIFPYFNFDMLASAVEEMNRYGENLAQVLNILNIEPEMDQEDTYELTLGVKDYKFSLVKNYKRFDPNDFAYNLWLEDLPKNIKEVNEVMEVLRRFANLKEGNVKTSGNAEIGKVLSSADLMDDDDDDRVITFGNSELVSFDQTENKFIYKIEAGGEEIFLTVKRNETTYSWGKYHPSLL